MSNELRFDVDTALLKSTTFKLDLRDVQVVETEEDECLVSHEKIKKLFDLLGLDKLKSLFESTPNQFKSIVFSLFMDAMQNCIQNYFASNQLILKKNTNQDNVKIEITNDYLNNYKINIIVMEKEDTTQVEKKKNLNIIFSLHQTVNNESKKSKSKRKHDPTPSSATTTATTTASANATTSANASASKRQRTK
jgi:hypothetical protein